MILPDINLLLDAAGGLPATAFAGSLFAFFSKPKTEVPSNHKLQEINHAVHNFLESKEVTNFKVYTILCEANPVVLIQAEPQKKLRFSNILEVQIKTFLSEKLAVDVPAVFWRFKTDERNEPGPEQAGYSFEEAPRYPADQPSAQTAATPPAMKETKKKPQEDKPPEPAKSNDQDLYDLHQTTRQGMQVEEISMGEFDAFLKGGGGKNP